MLTNTQLLTLHINQGNRPDSQAWMDFQKKSSHPAPPSRSVFIYMYILMCLRGIFSSASTTLCYKKGGYLGRKLLGIGDFVKKVLTPLYGETEVSNVKYLEKRVFGDIWGKKRVKMEQKS